MLIAIIAIFANLFSPVRHLKSLNLYLNRGNFKTNILNWVFQSTTVQQTSSSAPVVTSVSMPTTGVMECLTALTVQMREPVVSLSLVLSLLEIEDVFKSARIMVT